MALDGFDADVIVVGAGPVGLTLSNALGIYGIKVLLIERGERLIDYPRGVGIDDECLRGFQAIGLAEEVLQHLTPFHWQRFVTVGGRRFASVEPRTDEFGWSRRNCMIQPMVDAELRAGLDRFPHVRVWMGCELATFEQDGEGVTAKVKRGGEEQTLRCRYLVGTDGGRSTIRSRLGVSFEGTTETAKWLVVDLRHDPIGLPNISLCCDPERPYVSAGLPDGVRRFEFMVFENETEEQITAPARMTELLAKVLPADTDLGKLTFIRKRVYTHSARIADRWMVGRVILAGDAAHLMPPTQGQGYNSGIRDATNLGWKLAFVLKGKSSPALLETYQMERWDHAKAMIDLSVNAGRLLRTRNSWLAASRDVATWFLNKIPSVKRYFTEMRFKPMPFYENGVVVHERVRRKESPVGRPFIQPKVRTREGEVHLLDDVLGTGFTLLAWGADPGHWLDDRSRAILAALGAKVVIAKPVSQVNRRVDVESATVIIGDEQTRLKEWFDLQPGGVVLLRPDRFVAGLAFPVRANEMLEAIAEKMGLVVDASAWSAPTDRAAGA